MRSEVLTKKTVVLSLITIMMGGVSGCMQSPAAKSAKYLEAGKKEMEKKDLRRAILDFRNAAQSNPRDAEAFYQLSQAYLASGDIPNGVNTLRKTLELDPKHKTAQLKMAELMSYSLDSGQLKDAQQRLKKILEDSPNSVDALHALALTELKLNDADEAVGYLERALNVAPRQVTIAATLADAKLQQKDARGAEEVLKKAAASSPKSAEAAILLGRFYAGQNRAAEAEQEYRRALALDGKHPAALSELAALELRMARKPEAEQIFRRMAGLLDKSINFSYANFLFQEGRREEAIREFERLAKQAPEDRLARTRLVSAYQAANQEEKAMNLLRQALKKNPSDMEALLQRGELFLSAHKYDLAEKDLNQVLRQEPSSAGAYYVMSKLHQARGETLIYRQDLTTALQVNPYLLTVRLELAQALIAGNSANAALGVLNETPESQKGSLPVLVQRNWAFWALGDMAEMRKGIDFGLSRQRNADLLIQDGLWKLSAGNFAGARTSADAALSINTTDVRALRLLSISYTSQKQNALALQKVKEYASREPKSAPVQDFLGTMLLAGGDRLQARAAFESALAVDPKSVEANLSLVQMDVLDGKFENAQRRLETLASSDPTNATARRWLANVLVSKGDQKAALDQYRQIVAADPGNAEALNNLAYLLAENADQPLEALKYAQKARELVPDNAQFSDTLGWILYRQGLYPLAVKELQRATAGNAQAVWKYHLAMAYAKSGDVRRGRAMLESALKQNPLLPEAKEAQEILRATSSSEYTH